MEFDVTPLTIFKTYCPTCSLIKEAASVEPMNCKVCGELLIFIELGHLPKEFEPKLTKKGLIGMMILLISAFGPLAPVILFYSTNLLILYFICMIGGVSYGVYLLFTAGNEQLVKLIKTYIPADLATIPLIKQVRVFQLGRYLSRDIVPCPRCKMLIPGDSKFCKECGARLFE